MWTSNNRLQFEYLGVSIRADSIGTKNATYTRVYDYPLERFGSKYVMLYSGYIVERGIRCIWMAHSTDAENWVQLKVPLVEPVEGENNSIYGPALWQYDNRYFIVYQDSTAWRGGNVKCVEVDSVLNQVGKGGERFVLIDPPPGPPLNDRYRGGEFYLENDTFYLYSSASRDPRILVYATASAVPNQGGTGNTSRSKKRIDSKITIYPNPFSDALIIDTPNTTSRLKMKLYDLNGRLLKSMNIDNSHNRIVLENLWNGIYIIEICDSNNHLIQRQKLIRYK